MYTLIRESEFKFRISTKNEWKKNNKKKLKNSTQHETCEVLECSNDDSELLNEMKENLTDGLPKVTLKRMSLDCTLSQPSSKKIRVIEDILLDFKLNFSDVNKDFISSTPNTSNVDDSISKWTNNSDTSKEQALFISPIQSSTKPAIKIINVHDDQSQQISETLNVDTIRTNYSLKKDANINLLEKMSTSNDPCMNNMEDITNNVTEELIIDNFLDVIEESQLDQETYHRMILNSKIFDLSDEQVHYLQSAEEDFESHSVKTNSDVLEVNLGGLDEPQHKSLNVSEQKFGRKQSQVNSDHFQNFISNLKAPAQLMQETETEDDDPDYVDEGNNPSDSENSNVISENAENSQATPENNKNKEILNATVTIEKNLISKGFDVSLPIPKAGQSSVNTPPEIYVANSVSGAKHHACLYCGKLDLKIARHLELHHKDQKEVKAFLSYKPKDPIRKSLIAKIRSRGDHEHNQNLKSHEVEVNSTSPKNKNKKKEYIVVRRPKEGVTKDPSDFAICGNCQASISVKTLAAHCKHCTGQTGKNRRVFRKLSKLYENNLHPNTSPQLRALLVSMHDDETSQTIKYDSLLIKFGNILCEKYKDAQNDELIRNRLRMLGRLLVTIKKIENDDLQKNNAAKDTKPQVSDMESLFNPINVKICIRAINALAGISCKNSEVRAPSVASTCGTLLKQLGEFLVCENIMDTTKEKNENVKDFLNVIAKKFSYIVNRNVLEAQLKQKRKKKISLPSTNDINKLMDYLIKLQSQSYDALKNEFSIKDYKMLAATTLIRVELFNRRRPGETERVLLEDFENYDRLSEDTHKDILKNLSAKAREFSKKYVRFSIRGKKGREVSVLLDEKMFESINLLVENRSKAGIHSENPFLFGLPEFVSDKHKYMRACKLLRQFSSECGADVPSDLRATKLRKHIATYLVNHNIANLDRTKLANHLGHNMGIHQNYYHLINVAEEICELPQVLEKACGANNNLTDIESTDESDSNSEVEETSKNKCMRESKVSEGVQSDADLDCSISIPMRRKIWTIPEVTALRKHFNDKLQNRTYPSKKEMEKVRAIEPSLKNREIPATRTWFCNYYKKLKKMES